MTGLLCLLVAMTAPGDTATFVLRDFRFGPMLSVLTSGSEATVDSSLPLPLPYSW